MSCRWLNAVNFRAWGRTPQALFLPFLGENLKEEYEEKISLLPLKGYAIALYIIIICERIRCFLCQKFI
jgi:hypothetical protein